MLFYFHIKVQHSLIGSTVTKGFSNNPQYGLVVVVRFDSTMLQIQTNMLNTSGALFTKHLNQILRYLRNFESLNLLFSNPASITNFN